jgi:glucan phosphoethanolaminetransferase (alkaline phosphatase superfamily)
MFNNLIITLCITCSILLPDVVLGHWLNLITSRVDFLFFGLIILFSFSISFIKQKKILIPFLIFLFFLQMTQINFWLYFGLPIEPDHYGKIFSELDEIFLCGSSDAQRLWKGWLVLSISFILMFFPILYLEKKVFKRAYLFALSPFFIIFALAIYIGNTFITRQNTITFAHSIRSYALYLSYKINKFDKPEFKDYILEKTDRCEKNIILIMGESTAARYQSLYDYDLDTTPYLKSLKSNEEFAYARGISSSVCTTNSLTLFFNCVREPQNTQLFFEKEFNLFKLAEMQDYNTVFITSQNLGFLHDLGIKHVKQVVQASSDEDIWEKLSSLKLEEKNFIVLHVRHIHAPYKIFHERIKPPFPIDNTVKSAYVGAMLYHDDWVKKTIEKIKSILPTETPIIFTSDHAELVGENGMYGHSILDVNVADVPVWSICPQNHSLLNWMRSNPYITHYELSCQIAKLLGFIINNPNDDKTTYYIAGISLFNPTNIELKKKDNSVEFTKIDERANQLANKINKIELNVKAFEK